MKIKFMSVLVMVALAAIWSACTDQSEETLPVADAGKKKTVAFEAPQIDFASATQTAITLKITGKGSLGAPAGFSLQWITKAALDANNGVWPTEGFCKAGFSGNASGYDFNLSENEEVFVEVGDVIYDTPGASSECVEPLVCGTEYVFRAFAHATSTVNKSDWSALKNASTDACEEICVYGQGYWKNHGPSNCNLNGSQPNEWPLMNITIGSTTYDATEAENAGQVAVCGLFQLQGSDNTLIHQLIAALFNQERGASTSGITYIKVDGDWVATSVTVANAIAMAQTYLSGGSVSYSRGQLTSMLDSFNQGVGGSACP